MAEVVRGIREAASVDPIDQEKVDRATALNDAVTRTKEELRQAWTASIDLSDAGLAIKSVWLEILQAVLAMVRGLSEAANWVYQIGVEAEKARRSMVGSLADMLGAGAVNKFLREKLGIGWDPNAATPTAPKPDITVGGRTIANQAEPMKQTAAAAKEAASAIDQLNLRVGERIGLLGLEAQGMGKTSAEVIRLKANYDLEKAALKDGVTVSEEQRAAYDRQIDRIVELTKRTEEARKQQQLFNELASAGSTAFSGFINSILSGKSPIDALTSSLSGLGSKLTDIGSKSLFDSLTAGLKGGGFSLDPVSIGIGALGIGLTTLASMTMQNTKEQTDDDSDQRNCQLGRRDGRDRRRGVRRERRAACVRGQDGGATRATGRYRHSRPGECALDARGRYQRSFPNFDTLGDRAEAFVEDFLERRADELGFSGNPQVDLIAAGWSHRADRPRAFVVSSVNFASLGDAHNDNCVQPEAFELLWADDGVALPSITPESLAAAGFVSPRSVQDLDPVADGVRFLVAQRHTRHAVVPGGTPKHLIGGYAMHAVVTRDGVTMRKGIDFGDTLGEPIVPKEHELNRAFAGGARQRSEPVAPKFANRHDRRASRHARRAA